MPVRDGEAYIGRAIDSILKQSLPSIELIVIDDGSSDRSAAITKQFAARDPRIRLVSTKPSGIVAALEVGRCLAKAPFIARMDADDIAKPHRLQSQRDYLLSNSTIVAVGGQTAIIDAEDGTIGRGWYPVTPDACASYLHRGSPLCHPAVTMRASVLQECGGYRSVYGSAEDYDLWLRMARFGKLANLPSIVLEYRVHQNNVTRKNGDRMAVAATLAYLEAFLSFRLDGAKDIAERRWDEIEPSLPKEIRVFSRMIFLRKLSLNGGIVHPPYDRLLEDSLPALYQEAFRRNCRADLAFSLIRAAKAFAAAGRLFYAGRLILIATTINPRELLVALPFGRKRNCSKRDDG